MKRLIGVVVALACVALLSSCSLLPHVSTPFNDDSEQIANAQMRRIADAVKHHDVAALRKLFSPRAREKAIDLDGGLKYFLSFFPSGQMTWKVEDGGPGGGGLNDFPTVESESFASYKVFANGKMFDLYFADITTDTDHPTYVGIYALGVEPYSSVPYTGAGPKSPFDAWASQFATAKVGSGLPGVYIPNE